MKSLTADQARILISHISVGRPFSGKCTLRYSPNFAVGYPCKEARAKAAKVRAEIRAKVRGGVRAKARGRRAAPAPKPAAPGRRNTTPVHVERIKSLGPPDKSRDAERLRRAALVKVRPASGGQCEVFMEPIDMWMRMPCDEARVNAAKIRASILGK